MPASLLHLLVVATAAAAALPASSLGGTDRCRLVHRHSFAPWHNSRFFVGHCERGGAGEPIFDTPFFACLVPQAPPLRQQVGSCALSPNALLHVQAEWTRRDCDPHIRPLPAAAQKHQQSQRPPAMALTMGAAAGSAASPARSRSSPPPADPDVTWCREVMWKHDVRPGSSWGSLGERARGAWRKRNCDSKMTKTASFVDADGLPAADWWSLGVTLW